MNYAFLPKSLTLGCLLAWAAAALPSDARAFEPNEGEWRQLFNGRDLDGWLIKLHKHDLGDNYRDTFSVVDGMIQVRYDEYDEGGFGNRFGHAYYDERFSHYRLAVEYRFVGDLFPSAPDYARLNSGVMLHAQDPRTMPRGQDWPLSVEFQFLAGLPNGKPRPTGNVCTPGTHISLQGVRQLGHCHTSSGPTLPPGEWVRAEAEVRGAKIKHFINGELVLEYTDPVVGGGVIAGYDKEAFPQGSPLTSGYIALQAEGNGIDFRKVEIQVLDATD